MKLDIYEHFRPEERIFVDRAWEWVVSAGEYHKVKLTDFLDPRQSFILDSLVRKHPDAVLRLDGGYEGAERMRAVVAPSYRDLSTEEVHLKLLEITSQDASLSRLEHGDYMGALLSLGLKREKIGDIHVLEEGCHVVVAEETASYLSVNLRQVHKQNVYTDIKDIDQLTLSVPKLQMMDLSVASMRLDGIVSDVYRLSRSKVLIPIKAGRCRVNFRTEEDPSKPLKEGDMISLQGFGRFKVHEVEGISKKGRLRIKIGKFV